MSGAAERFWAFSLALYAKPGVAPACLALQDECGLDVNFVLFCCFAAAEGAPVLGRERLDAADRAVAPWRAGVIEPMRAARRAMKGDVAGIDTAWRERVRKQVQAAELECERMVQTLIVANADRGDSGPEASRGIEMAAANLGDYLAQRGAMPNRRQREALAQIVAAALGEAVGDVGAVLDRALQPRGEDR